jgi:hypothetical protein
MAENPLHNSTEENKPAEPSTIEVGGIEVGGDVRGNITVGHGNIITRIVNIFQGDTKGQLEQRNRRLMLDHVENFWVKGVLEKSLHGAALLDLGIKEDPGALGTPWTLMKEATGETLPAGTSMLEIFREIGLGRSLLILGAPGSGKTTLLLELARLLIQGARRDATEPIPVVFNLASWKETQSLADWLAEQLNLVYYVPRKIAPAWVEGNKMLLLLDGLDEVKEDRREACVEAINRFRKDNGFTSLVVCSRSGEYGMLKTRLSLDGAISLQPLTSTQVEAYFDRFGESLASVKQLLTQDQTLQELAETPLILSILALAYKGRKPEELAMSGDIESQRKHLFDTYINRMFERSARAANASFDASFTKAETLHYLSWLARKMVQNNLSTYQIEAMQPDWLPDEAQRRLYRLLIGVVFGLVGGLLGGLVFGLIDGLVAWLVFGFVSGLVIGLIAGQSVGAKDRIVMVDRLKWSWWEAQNWLVVGLACGVVFGLVGGFDVGPIDNIELINKLTWSWWEAVKWLGVGLVLGLLVGLLGGLTSEQIEETTYPGQRLKQTLFSGLFSTLLVGFVVGLGGGLLFGLLGGFVFGLNGGLLFGLLGGFTVGLTGAADGKLSGGYLPLIQHCFLRWVLTLNHVLPRRLIPFLEHCARLIFLRRVGGSYIFVHRLLMEHFAEMKA